MLLSRFKAFSGLICTIIWVNSILCGRGQKKCIYQCIFIKSVI
nr:MAG TPA: hypothetical protein [Caudoviricetes sp.]